MPLTCVNVSPLSAVRSTNQSPSGSSTPAVRSIDAGRSAAQAAPIASTPQRASARPRVDMEKTSVQEKLPTPNSQLPNELGVGSWRLGVETDGSRRPRPVESV